MIDYSQLPKVWCVMGKDARRYSSERLWGFTNPLVEHSADTYIKRYVNRGLGEGGRDDN